MSKKEFWYSLADVGVTTLASAVALWITGPPQDWILTILVYVVAIFLLGIARREFMGE